MHMRKHLPKRLVALPLGLLVLPLFLLANLLPVAQVRAADDLVVYADSLHSDWWNGSWGAAVDFNNPSPVQAGSASIETAINGNAWGGLYVSTDTALDSSGYTGVRFWVHGGAAGGQGIDFKVIDGDDSSDDDWQTGVALSLVANTWTQVTVSFSEVGNPADITGLVWQDTTGGSQPAFYVDGIVLIGYSGPTRTPSPTSPPGQGPALSVDVDAGVHPISPYIYGMNWASNEAVAPLAEELSLPVNRWGGNAVSRYNWEANVTNTGDDWYYENVPHEDADDFVAFNEQAGSDTLLTVPLIGWVARPDSPTQHPYFCSFKQADFPNQVSPPGRESYMPAFDPWDPPCGSGYQPDPGTGNAVQIDGHLADPTDTSVAVTSDFAAEWVTHLVEQHGTAANGGVKFYDLDNEPMLWGSTHHDVHPDGTTYDEMRDKTYAYAAAIKSVDPGAQTLGPVVWGICAYLYSGADGCGPGADYAAHGNMYFVPWYLQQMKAYEDAHGVRILDYLDLHSYPYASNVSLSGAGSAETQALRLRSTRSLWDPTYVDESWAGDPPGPEMGMGLVIQTIPRMKQWIAQYYPGTKTAITEYNWGALDHINGALAQADVLGIFGREGLDLATLWGPPAATEPGAYAFRMYLNYDGHGSAFGDTSIQAVSTDQTQLSIYAAKRTDDGAVTLVIVNKSGQSLTSPVTLSGVAPQSMAQVYRYSADHLGAILRQADQPVTKDGFTATFPANSITLFVLFPLDQPDLSSSYKAAGSPAPQAGDTVTYTIHLINQGLALTGTVSLTDTIPAGLAYVPGSLTASAGTVDDSQAPTLRWSGLPVASPVTLHYAVTVTTTAAGPITNVVRITYAGQPPLVRSATIVANGALVYLPVVRR
ncbi:MAG: glycoside hydrolase family 44 protein [Chloroflexota bacterium]